MLINIFYLHLYFRLFYRSVKVCNNVDDFMYALSDSTTYKKKENKFASTSQNVNVTTQRNDLTSDKTIKY